MSRVSKRPELLVLICGAPFPLPKAKETRLDLFSPSFDVVKKCALRLHSEGKQRDLENKRKLGQWGAQSCGEMVCCK